VDTAQPLSPLEKDIFLVQSNGVAEWLKISLAENFDISAANRIELPGRFLWTIYRSMLGKAEIPSTSSLDKMPLTWRLMRLIPALLQDNDFSPLKHFLADGDAERRYQLVSRLADLIDLYQVYRTDWLQDWSLGLDQLRRANGELVPLPADQRWQAKLWRAILADLPEAERLLGRVNVHRRFVARPPAVLRQRHHCHAGWFYSASLRCRGRHWKHYLRWPIIRKSYSPCPIPVSISGEILSRGASCSRHSSSGKVCVIKPIYP
jgi:exonuclease V gamma subunit